MSFKTFLQEQDSFVARVWTRLKKIAQSCDVDLEQDPAKKYILRDIKKLELGGWTEGEAVNHLRNLEEVDPKLPEDQALARMKRTKDAAEARTGKKIADIHVKEAITAGNAHLAAEKTPEALTKTGEFKRLEQIHPNLARQLKAAWDGDIRDAARNPKAVDNPTLFDKILAKFMKENQLLDKVVTDLKALDHLHMNTFKHVPLDKTREVPDKWTERYGREARR